MFTRKSKTTGALAILLLAAMACSVPLGVATPTPDVMETAKAFATHTALAAPPTTQPPTSETTPLPVATDTPSFTSTPSLTPTSEKAMVSVSVDTNCRVGPGKVYDWIGALMVGEQTEIFGRDQGGEYFYVRNPDKPNDFCWLWAKYATTTGNITVLPIFTPPPTPTPAPDFTVEYAYLESCVGWEPGFKITNTGGVTFKSVEVQVKDTDTGTTVVTAADLFDKRGGCLVAVTIPTLKPGDVGWAYASAFAYNPTGNKMKATITLCTQTGLAGMCVTKTLEFKP